MVGPMLPPAPERPGRVAASELGWRNLAQSIEHDARVDAYTHLQGLEVAWFEDGDPRSGQVLIDGHDLRTPSYASLRRSIGYVGQDVFLFQGTVGENIAYGRADASDAEIQPRPGSPRPVVAGADRRGSGDGSVNVAGGAVRGRSTSRRTG